MKNNVDYEYPGGDYASLRINSKDVLLNNGGDW